MLPRGQDKKRTVVVAKGGGPFPGDIATNSSISDVVSTLGDPMQQTGGSVGITGSVMITANPVVTYTHTLVGVTNSSTKALTANSSAKYRLFVNCDMLTDITISLSVAAVAETQIIIPPKGQFVMSIALGNMDTRQVNCIATQNAPNLSVTEGV